MFLIFSCISDHVPDWQPRILLGIVEARLVNVNNTTATLTSQPFGREMLCEVTREKCYVF